MEIEEIVVGQDILVIALKGSLTDRQAEEVKAAFEAVATRGIPYVIADLAGVPFIDSSGLMAIVAGHKRLREQGVNLKLAAPVPQVRLVFELTKANKFMSLYYDREEAINSIPRS
jgi:anti-sigma B factor antagonist